MEKKQQKTERLRRIGGGKGKGIRETYRDHGRKQMQRWIAKRENEESGFSREGGKRGILLEAFTGKKVKRGGLSQRSTYLYVLPTAPR